MARRDVGCVWNQKLSLCPLLKTFLIAFCRHGYRLNCSREKRFRGILKIKHKLLVIIKEGGIFISSSDVSRYLLNDTVGELNTKR